MNDNSQIQNKFSSKKYTLPIRYQYIYDMDETTNDYDNIFCLKPFENMIGMKETLDSKGFEK